MDNLPEEMENSPLRGCKIEAGKRYRMASDAKGSRKVKPNRKGKIA
jgi:hypothetical protein